MTDQQSPPSRSDSNKPRPKSGIAYFFSYHGIWAPGVRLFRRIGFAAKAVIITLAFAIPLLSVLAWQLAGHHERTYQARLDLLQQHVEIAVGAVSSFYHQTLAGEITVDEAQAAALKTVSRMRFNGEDYFWINDLQARILMHPVKPALNGTDGSNLIDPNGVAIFSEFARTARNHGKGYVNYQWPKPGVDHPEDKVAFVAEFKPWGWVIGTGLYLDDLERVKREEVILTIGIVSVALMFAGYLFVCFYRVMDGGLRETRRHLRAMSIGDLTTSPSPWGKDEAASLMLELRHVQDSLRGTVLKVRQSSESIVHSSVEIASGTADLSTRTEQAANSLEQSAAAMEKISTNVGMTADNIREASSVAQLNAQSAIDGGHVMQQVVQTMEGIHASSAKINEIIGTIDGITFQTNLLALNAAVEAARAGEQGRGFAIVANEVRALAQRSAHAAFEVKTLIGGSVEQIENGTHIVRKAASTIEGILDSSQRVDALLGEVATAAQEQTQGVSHVGTAVQDLDRMTDQNAAMVAETYAGANAMKQQAQTLAQSVAHFKTPEGMTLTVEEDPSELARFDFDQAIEAHRQWKVKLRKAISDQSTLDAETICKDNQCPLGKWIYGDGKKQCTNPSIYDSLKASHADFHRTAGAVAEKINAGEYADAGRLIEPGSRFAEVSNEVASILTRARRNTKT